MNLNLSNIVEVISSPITEKRMSFSIKKTILFKLIVFLLLLVLAFIFDLYLEMTVAFFTFLVAHRGHLLYRDLASIDLHFSNDDLDMNEIIDDLWN